MTQTYLDPTRLSQLNDKKLNADGKAVIYWMQKDQRAYDNWALIRAQELANELKVPLIVAFFVSDKVKNAYLRHYEFMLRGLAETAQDLSKQGIGFVIKLQDPVTGIVNLMNELDACAIVTDQAYLRLGKQRRSRAADALHVSFEAVDASMIVPPKVLSDKQLYAAYIARPKLNNHLDQYLTDYPNLEVDYKWFKAVDGEDIADISKILDQLKLDPSSVPVSLASGSKAAEKVLEKFVSKGVSVYKDSSSDPVASSTSQLSAYLHYGQISAQRVAWDLKHVSSYQLNKESTDKYLDELITWRELSTNFAFYNPKYDSYEAVPDWARKSLELHMDDDREYTYTLEEFEFARTHDDLWNAGQTEMVKTGRMHGYLRMYWAKKILEWTKTPAEAIEFAVYLNDKYELDGREPNGYAGILWAIGGLHDRPWFEREVYGQIRYMNYNGAKKKFDVPGYITWVESL